MTTEISQSRDYFNKESVKKKFTEILGSSSRATTFMVSVLQLVANNGLLRKAEPESVFNAAVTAAVMDLPLNENMGFAYIVPYKDNKTGKVIAKLMVGYKGFKQLAIRSGKYRILDAKVVYEGQKVADSSFVGFRLEWDKKISDKVVGYVSYFRLLNGYESIHFMSLQEVEMHAKKYSQVYRNGTGKWNEEFDKMALKTVTRLHLSSGDAPLSFDMQGAVVSDEVETVEVAQDEDRTDKTSEVLPQDEEDADNKERRARLLKFIADAQTIERLEEVSDYLYDYNAVEEYNTRKQQILDLLEKQVKEFDIS